MDFCPCCGNLILPDSGHCDQCETRFAATPPVAIQAPTGDRAPPRPQSFQAGETVGNRYQIIERLGIGGMGTVFRARDRLLELDVALKIISLDIFEKNDPARRFEALSRFKSEVIYARRVHHPNVCRIYDISSWEGYLFVTMELLEGQDLHDLLYARGLFAWEDALPILTDVLDALAAVHEAGLIHMDLKPENIFITRDGRAHLMDFGISRTTWTGGSGDPDASVMVGTPEYMAPEQVEGSPATVHSDIYAVGCVLYEMLTGRLPVMGETTEEILRKKVEEGPELKGAIWESLRPKQKEIIRTCLQQKPGDRFRDTLEILDQMDLTPGARGSVAPGISHRPKTSAGPFPMRQIKIALAVAGGLVLVALAMLLWSLVGTSRP
jgi:serine/threonine-protein kinase